MTLNKRMKDFFMRHYGIPANAFDLMVKAGFFSKWTIRYFEIFEHFERNKKKTLSTHKAVLVTAKELDISERRVYRAIKQCKDSLLKNH